MKTEKPSNSESGPRIRLAYKGKRLSKKNTWIHEFEQEGTKESLFFSCKLHRFAILGDVLEVTRTETGVAAPYEKVSRASTKQVQEWSIEERKDIEELRAIREAKIKPEGHVDELIQAVAKSCRTFADRKRMAFYIMNKLIT